MAIGLGVSIYAAVKPVLKIYVIIFVGYLLARYNLVTVETSRGISNMVVNAILPCLTFNKIVGNISDKDIKEVGVLVLTALLIFTTGGVAAYLTKWATNSPRKWYWGLLFAGVFPNISDLPIAYVQSMSNGSVFTTSQVDRGVAYCCIFLCTQSFLMMNFGMFRIVGLDFREPKKDEEQCPDNTSSTSRVESKSDRSTPNSTSISTLHNRGSTRPQHDDKASPNSQHPEHVNDQDTPRSLSDNDDEVDLGTDPQHFLGEESSRTSLSSSFVDEGMATPQVPQTSNSFASQRSQHSTASISSSLFKVTTGRSNSSSNSVRSQRKRAGRHRRPSQSMKDVINEYSAAERIKTGEMNLMRPLSLTQELGEENAFLSASSDSSEDESVDHSATSNPSRRSSVSHLSRTKSTKSKKLRYKMQKLIKKYRLGWLVYILVNFCRPASLGALLGIIFCMIPWVKALFVNTDVHVHKAPDGQPVLNFVMDFTGYVGNACIPLGLLLLGGTLARLEVKSLPKGFWKTIVMMTTFRLVVLPIVGIAWANKLAL